MELDRDRLAKLLNLTGSDHDAEALAAIRKANELLRQSSSNWEDALGLSFIVGDLAPESERAASTPSSDAKRPINTPPRSPSSTRPSSFQLTVTYRDAFRREPFLPRLLAFPFWILVELLALIKPHKSIDTRGPMLATVFTLSMMLGIVAWIGLGYAVIFR